MLPRCNHMPAPDTPVKRNRTAAHPSLECESLIRHTLTVTAALLFPSNGKRTEDHKRAQPPPPSPSVSKRSGTCTACLGKAGCENASISYFIYSFNSSPSKFPLRQPGNHFWRNLRPILVIRGDLCNYLTICHNLKDILNIPKTIVATAAFRKYPQRINGEYPQWAPGGICSVFSRFPGPPQQKWLAVTRFYFFWWLRIHQMEKGLKTIFL